MAVPILMYHSVSDAGPGPVSLPSSAFRDQVAVLADTGARGITVSQYVAARKAGGELPRGTVVLTFDDGYRDFADRVFPVLQKHGWGATVFVPIAPVDEGRPWDCGDGHRRELLSWHEIGELASNGVEFGAHSINHTDLTRLPAEDAREEIAMSGERLYEQTGRRVEGFAPPFGRADEALRHEMARHYSWSVGTRLDRAWGRSDLFDLPRIEMWYFRSRRRWRQYVLQGWTGYFAVHQAMRAFENWRES